jgi:hypothetical protein
MREMLVRPHIPMSKDKRRYQETVRRPMSVMGRLGGPKGSLLVVLEGAS